MNAQTTPSSLFASGFRPFFLLAGAYGALSVGYWILAYAGIIPIAESFAPAVWHGHEMLFGFALAAAAGFLLTVIPAWTGTEPVAGGRLAALAGLWLLGRAAFWLAAVLPPIVVAAADLALPVALIVIAAARLIRGRNLRNAVFPVLLTVMALANACVHAEALGWTQDTAILGLHLAMHVFILMIVLIGGRIIPMFTANVLAARGEIARPTKNRAIEILCFVGVVAVAGLDLTGYEGPETGFAAALAAIALTLRMAGWRSDRTLDLPLLWILHLGHAWLPVAYALKAAAGFGIEAVTPDAFVHAVTAGAMGTAILAIMTRASLGHTGRPLTPPAPIVVAYYLIAVAAPLRVFAPLITPEFYVELIAMSGLMWSAAFAIFAVVYAPILASARADGRPG